MNYYVVGSTLWHFAVTSLLIVVTTATLKCKTKTYQFLIQTSAILVNKLKKQTNTIRQDCKSLKKHCPLYLDVHKRLFNNGQQLKNSSTPRQMLH